MCESFILCHIPSGYRAFCQKSIEKSHFPAHPFGWVCGSLWEAPRGAGAGGQGWSCEPDGDTAGCADHASLLLNLRGVLLPPAREISSPPSRCSCRAQDPIPVLYLGTISVSITRCSSFSHLQGNPVFIGCIRAQTSLPLLSLVDPQEGFHSSSN